MRPAVAKHTRRVSRGTFDSLILEPEDILHDAATAILGHAGLSGRLLTRREAAGLLGTFVIRACQHASRRQAVRRRLWLELEARRDGA